MHSAEVVRCSIDARRKSDVHFVVNAAVELADSRVEQEAVEKGRAATFAPLPELEIVQVGQREVRPLVVGAGPAGLFCALYLARAGARPLLVERGEAVEDRMQAIAAFNAGGALDPSSNVQFGEGGAGTFSDGKLNTGTKHRFAPYVLRWFADAGAPQEILWEAKPHIGSDLLPGVVRSLREQIIALGGEVRFRTRLADLLFEGGRLRGALLEGPDGTQEQPVRHLALALGHSARDTFEMLKDRGVELERKPFAMGVRIEHPQQLINRGQWGEEASHPALRDRAADYKMAVHVDERRSAYTFCMCPGGTVVAAASEPGGVVTNGMSEHARDGRNANAALLVNVDPADLPGEDPLAGVRLQRELEQRAYKAAIAAGGEPYSAPAQTVGSFLEEGAAGRTDASWADPGLAGRAAGGQDAAALPVRATYPRGVVACDLRGVLPDFVADTLEKALPRLDARLHGFASPDAIMTAPESRSSSPVRIVRGSDLQMRFADGDAGRPDGEAMLPENEAKPLHGRAMPPSGVYPCGEGAGYAGGIVSAAADGMRVAEALVRDLLVEDAAQALRQGRAVAFPTDTVFGLGVSVGHVPSPEEIYRIKQRSADKPVAWLVADADALDEYGCDVPAYAYELAEEGWPGALTLIVRAGDRVPAGFASERGTIGLRVPASDTACKLIRAVGFPLATSSANLSGGPTPVCAADLKPAISEAAACILPDRACEAASGTASRVIDCTGPAPRQIRP